jgi:hypothetical protein
MRYGDDLKARTPGGNGASQFSIVSGWCSPVSVDSAQAHSEYVCFDVRGG